jgi:hypothetical protein
MINEWKKTVNAIIIFDTFDCVFVFFVLLTIKSKCKGHGRSWCFCVTLIRFYRGCSYARILDLCRSFSSPSPVTKSPSRGSRFYFAFSSNTEAPAATVTFAFRLDSFENTQNRHKMNQEPRKGVMVD